MVPRPVVVFRDRLERMGGLSVYVSIHFALTRLPVLLVIVMFDVVTPSDRSPVIEYWAQSPGWSPASPPIGRAETWWGWIITTSMSTLRNMRSAALVMIRMGTMCLP